MLYGYMKIPDQSRVSVLVGIIIYCVRLLRCPFNYDGQFQGL